MLLELNTGRTRPLRRHAPLCSSAAQPWDGFLIEEYPPAAWASMNVSLLNSAIYLMLDDPADLEWRGDGRSVSMRVAPGRISILPANHPYSVRLRAAGGTVVVSLEPKLLLCAAAEQGAFGDIEPVWAHGIDDALLRELVLELRTEARHAGRHNAGYARALASALAARIVRRYATDRLRIPERPGGLTVPALRAAIQFIQEHPDEDISIERLASRANLSSCHFARMFKQSTGMPPHQFVLRCRIARAKQLLMNKSASLAEVAALAGFCDQGHMTRGFRRFVGLTPGAYSESLREGTKSGRG